MQRRHRRPDTIREKAPPPAHFGVQAALSAFAEPERPRAYLISGCSGAGKSTVSRALAERSRRSTCIDGDLITALIVSGGRPPTIDSWSHSSDTFDEETDRQLQLRFRVIGRMAKTYLEYGFTVVVDSFFAEPWVGFLLDELTAWEVHLITIDVPRSIRYERIRLRCTEPPIDAFDRLTEDALAAQPRGRGLWVDGASMSPTQLVDLILRSPAISRLEPPFDCVPPASIP